MRSQAGAPPLINGPLLRTPFLLDARMGCGSGNASDLVVARPDWNSPYRYCFRSLRAQTVALRINARAGEAGQTISAALNGIPLTNVAFSPPAAKPEDTPCTDLLPLTLTLREGLNYLTLQPFAADGTTKPGNNAPMLNCLKFTSAEATATLPSTLPWVNSPMNTQCAMAENTEWIGKFLFADGVTPANGWSGEMSSEDSTLIPNDAQHLALTHEAASGKLVLSITARPSCQPDSDLE